MSMIVILAYSMQSSDGILAAAVSNSAASRTLPVLSQELHVECSTVDGFGVKFEKSSKLNTSSPYQGLERSEDCISADFPWTIFRWISHSFLGDFLFTRQVNQLISFGKNSNLNHRIFHCLNKFNTKNVKEHKECNILLQRK